MAYGLNFHGRDHIPAFFFAHMLEEWAQERRRTLESFRHLAFSPFNLTNDFLRSYSYGG